MALTYVTATARELRVPLAEFETPRRVWRDVLTGRYIRAEDDSLRVPLDAYDIIWLEPSRA